MPEVFKTGIYETREELFRKIVEMTKQKKRNVDIARKVGINSGSVVYIQKKLGIYKRKNKVRKDVGITRDSTKPYRVSDGPVFEFDESPIVFDESPIVLETNKPIVLDTTIKPSFNQPLRKQAPTPRPRIEPGLTLVLDNSTAQMLYDSVADMTEQLGFQPTLTQAIRYMATRQRAAR